MAVPTLRTETQQLVELARVDLNRLWRLVARGAVAEVVLRELLPAIISEYGAVGAALAAEWYEQQREKAGARGRFTPIPVEADDRGAQALVSWSLERAANDETLKALVLGGVQRRIADHVRYTIMGSSIADPGARGWQRVSAGNCYNGFCDMLAGRGAVYSESSVRFAAHDNCRCSVVPAWKGQPLPVKPYVVSPRRTIDPETGKPVIDVNFLRAKQWIADHL